MPFIYGYFFHLESTVFVQFKERGELNMQNKSLRYLTYRQVMEYLHIGSVNTVYKMIADGLPVITIGRLKRIDREALDEYLATKSI